MSYLTSLDVYTMLNYPPKRIADGTEKDSVTRQVHRVCLDIKDGRLAPFAKFLEENRAALLAEIGDALTGRFLVPVPPSEVTSKAPVERWSTTRLANALGKVFGLEVATPLIRAFPVGRNSQARKEGRERNSPIAHIDSLKVSGDLPKGPITLVDDIVSSGATLIGAADVLRRSGAKDVLAFAAAFTVDAEVEHFADPHKGLISWTNPHNNASRSR